MANSKDIQFENWTPDHVAEWLRGLDDAILPYVHFFLNNGVNGKRLLMLTHSDLEKLNVLKLGHQELLLEAVDLLRNLRYGHETENLQHLALQLGCKARSLHNEIQANAGENDQNRANMSHYSAHSRRLSITVLSAIADLLTTLKNLVSWLDRAPFEGIYDLCLLRNTIVKIGLDLLTSSQRDSNLNEAEEFLMKSCRVLADICDELVMNSKDPLVVQPASLELATIRKKPEEELGMHIQSLYYGIHVIGGIKDLSPADLCRKIEKGDEVIQVNYQTVLGWQLKKLVATLKEKPREVVLLLKKRPRHISPFGNLPNRKKQANKHTPQAQTLPKLQKKRRSREGDKQVRPSLQDLANTKASADNADTASKEVTDGNDTDNDVFRSGSESPQFTLPVVADPKQRRATVSGGSPTLEHPSLVIEDLDPTSRPKSQAISAEKAAAAAILDSSKVNPEVVPRTDNPTAEPQTSQEFRVTKPIPQVIESPYSDNSQAWSHQREEKQKSDDSAIRPPKKVVFTSDCKEDEKNADAVSYTHIVVGGVVQKIPEDKSSVHSSESPSAVRRRNKPPGSGKRLDRRVSCKDLGRGDCEGWLFKRKMKNRSPLTKHWVKRWCVLKLNNLYTYKEKKDERAEGVVYLPGFQVSPAPDIKTNKHAFKIHNPGTTFYFASERQDDMSKWMNKMGLAAIRYDTSHVVTTGGFIKPEPPSQGLGMPNTYYSESEDESECQSNISGSLMSLNSLSSCGSQATEQQSHKDTDRDDNAQNVSTSMEELDTIYTEITRHQLAIDGTDKAKRRRSQITTMDVLSASNVDEKKKMRHLQSIQRTLKAKQQELNDIEDMLSGNITPEKLHDFQRRHAEIHPADSN